MLECFFFILLYCFIGAHSERQQAVWGQYFLGSAAFVHCLIQLMIFHIAIFLRCVVILHVQAAWFCWSLSSSASVFYKFLYFIFYLFLTFIYFTLLRNRTRPISTYHDGQCWFDSNVLTYIGMWVAHSTSMLRTMTLFKPFVEKAL